MMTFKKIYWGLLVIIPFFYSCNKETSNIGLSTIDEDNLLSVYTDSSVSFNISTVLDNEIRTEKFTYTLGSYNDPITGKHRASFATRLYLDTLNTDLSKYDLDYISFEMYDTLYYYGDTNIAQTISIYELTESLDSSDIANYYNGATIPTFANKTSGIKIGEQQYTPQLSADGGFTYVLPDAYAQNLYSKLQYLFTLDPSSPYFGFLDTVPLKSLLDTTVKFFDNILIQEFKGLYVTTDYEDAAIVRYFSPQLRFHLTPKAGEDKLVNDTIQLVPSPVAYDYESTDDTERVYLQSLSVFEHEFPSSITNKLGKTSTETFIQGNAGLKTKIEFNNLETWRDSSVIINSAILEVPILNTDTTDFPLPPAVNFRVLNADGELVFSTLSTVNDGYKYSFNCQYFVTYLFNNPEQVEKYNYSISVPENNIYSNRVILDGANLDNLKFTITYTK